LHVLAINFIGDGLARKKNALDPRPLM